jgi:ribose 5-phosphate isomerase A
VLPKQAAAKAAVELIQDGMIVGLGTGSTAEFAVAALGRRVNAGLRITGIPTSEATAAQARALGIPLATLGSHPRVDLTIDGADEVQRATLHLIKGRGGALLREKIVAAASARLVIIVDQSKVVDQLGAKMPVPVEVVRFGWQATEYALREIGAEPVLRAGPFVTDEGHYILDCMFGAIAAPGELARRLDAVTGVVEHGLFIGMAAEVLVGSGGGVTRLSQFTG